MSSLVVSPEGRINLSQLFINSFPVTIHRICVLFFFNMVSSQNKLIINTYSCFIWGNNLSVFNKS
jgi:hypothetical protein